jgi:hypothetical protein
VGLGRHRQRRRPLPLPPRGPIRSRTVGSPQDVLTVGVVRSSRVHASVQRSPGDRPGADTGLLDLRTRLPRPQPYGDELMILGSSSGR